MADHPDNEVLYQDGATTVTPSWLQLDNTSYAVRTIIRLSFEEKAPPRTSAQLAFVFSLILILASGFHVFRESLPPLLAWSMLLASIALMLVASWFAFVEPSRYRLDITLQDGSVLQVFRPSRDALMKIHNALSRAVDWHRGHASGKPHAEKLQSEISNS